MAIQYLESFARGNRIASITVEVARTGRPEAKRESVKLPVVPVLVFLDGPYQGDAGLRQGSKALRQQGRPRGRPIRGGSGSAQCRPPGDQGLPPRVTGRLPGDGA